MRKQREGGVTEPATATQVGKDSCHHQDMDLHIHLNQQLATPMELSCVHLPSGVSTRGLEQEGAPT